jgi:hypothetical protein
MVKKRILRPIVRVIPRKNKADQHTVDLILKAIEKGNTQKDAAILAGVDQDTVTNWKKYSDFSDQVRLAEIKFKAKLLQVIDEAALTDPKEAKWRLERLCPEEFSLKTQKDMEPLKSEDTLEKILATVSSILDGNYMNKIKSPQPVST